VLLRTLGLRIGLGAFALLLALHFLELIPMTNGDLVRSPGGYLLVRASEEFSSDAKLADLARAGAMGKRGQVVDLVFEGADPEGKGDHYGLTALIFTVMAGNLEGARALIEAGADPNQQVRRLDNAKIRSMIGPEPNIAFAEWRAKRSSLIAFDSESPLSIAVQSRNPEIARFLLESGANPNIGGRTSPVLFNCLQQGPEPSLFLKLLIAHGGDPNLRRPGGATLLGWFLYRGQVHNVLYLLENGADPTLTERKGFYTKPYEEPFDELNSYDYNDAAMLLQRITGQEGKEGGPEAGRIWEIFKERGVPFPVYDPGCRIQEQDRKRMTILQALRSCHMTDELIEGLVAYHTQRGDLWKLDGLPEQYAREKDDRAAVP
jgi:hypothetical protein